MNVESDPIEVVKRPLSAIDVEKLSITLNIGVSGAVERKTGLSKR